MTTASKRMTGPLLVVLFLGAMGSATAQDSQPSGQTRRPNVEIGLAVSGLFTSGHVPGIGLRVTGGNGGRFSVEGQLDWTDALNAHRLSDEIVWFYYWQTKQTLWSGRNTSGLFATYGTAGWSERNSVGFDVPRFESSLIPPILPMVGVGWQQVVAKYFAIRADAQLVIAPFGDLIPLVPRASIGLSVPIRGYTP